MADENMQQTAALRLPVDPGGNGPRASATFSGADTLPCVGIVWGVPDGHRLLRLVIDRTGLAAAETYGDHLTHPRGHHEVWEDWRRLGPARLARCGLPALIAWHEYEYFPRGRVVFNVPRNRFILFADRRLQAPRALPQVLRAFGLDPTHCAVRPDPHYRSTHDL